LQFKYGKSFELQQHGQRTEHELTAVTTWSETVGLRTSLTGLRPKNRSWSWSCTLWSWSCWFCVVLWNRILSLSSS